MVLKGFSRAFFLCFEVAQTQETLHRLLFSPRSCIVSCLNIAASMTSFALYTNIMQITQNELFCLSLAQRFNKT